MTAEFPRLEKYLRKVGKRYHHGKWQSGDFWQGKVENKSYVFEDSNKGISQTESTKMYRYKWMARIALWWTEDRILGQYRKLRTQAREDAARSRTLQRQDGEWKKV